MKKNSRAKQLYCPKCRNKVWAHYKKSTGNYKSVPGIRECEECNLILHVEQCWASNYNKFSFGMSSNIEYLNHVTTSDIGFISKHDGKKWIDADDGIHFKVPKKDSRQNHEFQAKDITLLNSRSTDVDGYLQSTPAAKYRFWAVVKNINKMNDVKVGAAMWGRPVARLEDQENTLELTRFFMSDEAPKNSESRFLGLMTSYIADKGYNRFIAYSDPDQGHWGTIYRACGWDLIGETKGKTDWNNRDNRSAGPQEKKFKFEKVIRNGQM